MNPVFLDTVGLVALWNLTDQWHAAAAGAFAQMLAGRQPIVTTTFVLLVREYGSPKSLSQ